MRKFRNTFFYIATIGGFSFLIYWILQLGGKLEAGREIIVLSAQKNHWEQFTTAFINNLHHPLALLLAQIITIIIVARFFGWIATKIGQPTVIGEMIAGIVLGPSLIGMYFPEFSAVLFPAQSLGNLQFLSQVGLIFFMYIVGMELDLNVLRNKAHEAVVVSHASIIIPFALGTGLAYYIYDRFAPPNIQFSSFALFIGIAMSVTAFPVLARIVQERSIQKTKLGTIVITCAAADDITAWCILASVIAIVKAGSFLSAGYTMILAVTYIIVMIKVIRPFLKRIGELHSSRENLSKPIVAIFFLILILSSYTTEIIGIHALFGAFLAGAIMPENARFRSVFIEKIEDVALVILLPLFFAFTGLRTQIGLLNDTYLWSVTGLIILVAITGKFVGSALAAKFVGQSWKDSLSIGALMNTRGLMELVVLNIGYDLGVLTPEVFAMMVIMALLTTFMTGPALDIINKVFQLKVDKLPQSIEDISKYRVLISFGNPERGKTLLRVANALVAKLKDNTSVTAMHLSRSDELNNYNVEEYEAESFAPVIEESQLLNQKITTLFKASNDIDADIVEVTNKGDYDLLLVGVGQSIFEGSLLGRVIGLTTRIVNPDRLLDQVLSKGGSHPENSFVERTRQIIAKTKAPVGILVDNGLQKIERVFIPIFTAKDMFLVGFAQRLINNSSAHITVLDALGEIKKHAELKESIRAIEQIAPKHIQLVTEQAIEPTILKETDLMIISIDSWQKAVASKSKWLTDTSALILASKVN